MSEEGRKRLSKTSPVSSEIGTMWSGVCSSYGTPLGLITKTPASRSTPETFPNVPCTRPLPANSLLAR